MLKMVWSNTIGGCPVFIYCVYFVFKRVDSQTTQQEIQKSREMALCIIYKMQKGFIFHKDSHKMNIIVYSI